MLNGNELLDTEENSIVNHLVSMPGLGNATCVSRQLKKIMLATGGELLIGGYVYNITQKPLGGGVYKLSTQKQE